MKKRKIAIVLLLVCVMMCVVGCGSSLKGQTFYRLDSNGEKIDNNHFVTFTTDQFEVYNGLLAAYGTYELKGNTIYLTVTSAGSTTITGNYDSSKGTIEVDGGIYKK